MPRGDAGCNQIGGFLVALGPTSDAKIVGACAATMTDHATPIAVEGTSVDIVGTGGDGLVRDCSPRARSRRRLRPPTLLLPFMPCCAARPE